MDKRCLNEKEAALYIGMSCSFLRQDRTNGFRQCRTRGPNFIKVGKMVRYLKEDLDDWLDSCRQKHH